MWVEQRRKGVIEVRVWLVRGAEGAVRQDVRPVGEVETSRIQRGQPGFQ